MTADVRRPGETYDDKYKRPDYFRYRQWLYHPYIAALISKANLRAGCSVIDAGCGQGFFTALLAKHGLNAVGVDLSHVGIQSAKAQHAGSGATFLVGDVLSLNQLAQYDCVFVRSLSLYNRPDFAGSRATTDALLTCLKPGGVLIFTYVTNLCSRKKSETWMHHSRQAAVEHFSKYNGAKVYFSLRIECLLLGRWAFCTPITFLAEFVSRITGVGGELVAMVPHRRSEPH